MRTLLRQRREFQTSARRARRWHERATGCQSFWRALLRGEDVTGPPPLPPRRRRPRPRTVMTRPEALTARLASGRTTVGEVARLLRIEPGQVAPIAAGRIEISRRAWRLLLGRTPRPDGAAREAIAATRAGGTGGGASPGGPPGRGDPALAGLGPRHAPPPAPLPPPAPDDDERRLPAPDAPSLPAPRDAAAWDAWRWWRFFQERADALAREGGMTRAAAERRAVGECVDLRVAAWFEGEGVAPGGAHAACLDGLRRSLEAKARDYLACCSIPTPRP